jgi:hypothetical protein
MRMRLLWSELLCFLLLTSGASAQSLEQQALCAKQAKIALQEYEDDNRKLSPNLNQHSEYQSHYNTKLDKCLINIQTMIFGDNNITTSVLLMDAFEQRVYASYVWASPQVNSCDLILSSQDQRTCSSKEDFDAFVAKYMEE